MPAMAHTRPDDRRSPTPIWPDGVDDDSRALYYSVDVIAIRDIHYECRSVREVGVLVYESLEL